MSKIAVLIDNGFEDSEYTRPAEAFREAGHELVHLGSKRGSVVQGKKEETPVIIDREVAEALPADYDALLIPGGQSPDHLRADPEPVAFVKEFVESGKPVFFICHGGQLLITADVLKGRKVTGWRSIARDLVNAGADYRDQEVVVDKNFVSSRQPSDLDAFIRESLKKLPA
jgi:protease I